MWVFLNDAFLSIVDEKAKTARKGERNVRPQPGDILVVRARCQDDIGRVFGPGYKVQRDPSADYLFRARIPRKAVSAAMTQAVRDIDYGNFKDSVSEDDRHSAYSRVWGAMYQLQMSKHPRKPVVPSDWPRRRRSQAGLFEDDDNLSDPFYVGPA